MKDEYTSNIPQIINQKNIYAQSVHNTITKQIQTAKVSMSGSWNKQICMINKEMWCF